MLITTAQIVSQMFNVSLLWLWITTSLMLSTRWNDQTASSVSVWQPFICILCRCCLLCFFLSPPLASRCEAGHLHVGCDKSKRWKFRHAMWKTCSCERRPHEHNVHTVILVHMFTVILSTILIAWNKRRQTITRSTLNINWICFLFASACFCVLNSVFQKSSRADGREAKTNREWAKGEKREEHKGAEVLFSPSDCGDEPQMFVDRRWAISNSWSGIRFVSVRGWPPATL